MLASVGIYNELYEGVSFAWNIPRLLEISAFPVLVVEGYIAVRSAARQQYTET